MTDELNNKTVTSENDPISTLIGELKRVDAPGDFNFRVKARIAQGRPSEVRASWMPVWAKAAAPLGLALAVGGYIFSGGFYSGNVEMQPVAGVQPQTAVPVVESQKEAAVGPVTETVAEVTPIAPSTKAGTPRTTKVPQAPKPKREVVTGGSYDEAVRETKEITPKSSGADDPSDLGITSATANGARTVTALKPSSRAAKGGIRVGDVIESVKGNVLIVRRDGKTVIVTLK